MGAGMQGNWPRKLGVKQHEFYRKGIEGSVSFCSPCEASTCCKASGTSTPLAPVTGVLCMHYQAGGSLKASVCVHSMPLPLVSANQACRVRACP